MGAFDIRLDISFRFNRKRKKLYLALGAEAVLAFIDLMLATAESRPDGIFVGYDEIDIEIEAGWTGKSGKFVKTLLDIGFLDKDSSGTFSIHNWDVRQPWVFKSEERSDKCRFSRMAKTHPDIWDQLKETGVNSISKREYLKLTSIQKPVNDSLNNRSTKSNVALTPAPNPTPDPDPTPIVYNADSFESAFYTTKSGKKLSGKRLESFNLFWSTFNYKKGKAPAADSWLKIPKLTDSIVKKIIAAAKIEADNRPALIKSGGSPKWAQGWLTDRRWEDEAYSEDSNVIPIKKKIVYPVNEVADGP